VKSQKYTDEGLAGRVVGGRCSVAPVTFGQAPDVAFFVKDAEGLLVADYESCVMRHGLKHESNVLRQCPRDVPERETRCAQLRYRFAQLLLGQPPSEVLNWVRRSRSRTRLQKRAFRVKCQKNRPRVACCLDSTLFFAAMKIMLVTQRAEHVAAMTLPT
jgi:hypothetical protein